MKIVNIHEAKTHLSRLVEDAAKGEAFIIAKAGRKMAMVMALDAPTDAQKRRVGFMAGQGAIPEDFDRMGAADVEALFQGEP